MTWEDYATNDTAHGGACETEHDIELEDIRREDELDEARDVIAEQDSLGQFLRDPYGILAASRSVKAGTDMLFAALRKNGVFRP